MSYQLVDSFEIDDGSLSELSPERAFVLGVEWITFRSWMISGEWTDSLFAAHVENLARCCKLAEKYGYVTSTMPLTKHIVGQCNLSTIRLVKKKRSRS